jgi:hypothetical protein
MNNLLNETMIPCPKCGAQIRLTESLAAPILAETKKRYDEELARQQRSFQERQDLLKNKESELAKKSAELDTEIRKRLEIEREQILKEETKRARLEFNNQIRAGQEEVVELNRILADRDKSLAEARKEQAELKRKERELEDKKRAIELTVETRVNESLVAIRSEAQREAEGKLKLKITEKEHTIYAMQQQIEDLQRRAEQGSQQLQGEAQEIELEVLLRERFPGDIIEPVSKGLSGGDVLQRVLGPNGQSCGTIIWESKRTKNWSDGWLNKLRSDQRAINADAAIIVSEALPKGLETFDLIDGVWVAEFRCAIAVATAIRHALTEVSLARKCEEGQQTKMEVIYRYLSGPRFRQRVSAIVEQFSTMQEDLERERRTTTRLWSKREAQIKGVMEATAGMYGDLQGIAGRSFQEIDGLDHNLSTPCRKELAL